MASKAATSGVNLQRFRNPYWHVHQQKLKKEKLYMHNLKRARGATDFRGKPIFTPRTWNVTKGDLVQVTQPSLIKDFATGKAKQNQFGQSMTQKWLGQQGVVLAVLRKEERVIVEGINLKTRVMRVRRDTTQAEAEARSSDQQRADQPTYSNAACACRSSLCMCSLLFPVD